MHLKQASQRPHKTDPHVWGLGLMREYVFTACINDYLLLIYWESLLLYTHVCPSTSSDVLLLQWQRWEATEGQPALTEQRDQSGRQRRQPGGLRRRGCSVQRGWLVYRRVRWAKGKEGVLWDQSHRSDPSMRPGCHPPPPWMQFPLNLLGRINERGSRHYPHQSRVKCNASLPSAHCHLHFTNSVLSLC